MQPIERFYSQLAALKLPPDRDLVIREFTRLTAPVLGAPAAADFCRRALDRLGAAGDLQKVGAQAAFFLGAYDNALPLTEEDWEDIQSTLEDCSGEMDLSLLTSLMGDLLSQGKLS